MSSQTIVSSQITITSKQMTARKCGLVFGTFAAALACPFGFFRTRNVDSNDVFVVLIFELFLPVFIASVTGAILGRKISWNETTFKESFVYGLGFSLVSGIVWVCSAILVAMAMDWSGLVELSLGARMVGGVCVLSILGYPVYGLFGALAGLWLRSSAHK